MRRLAPLVLAVVSGCYPSAGTLMRVPTEPVGKAAFSGTVGTSLTEVETTDPNTGKVTKSLTVLPDIEMGIRQGLAEHLELGGRIWLLELSGRVDLKWQAIASKTFDLAIAPGLGLGIPAPWWANPIAFGHGTSIDPLRWHLPVLLGFHLGPHELLLGSQLIAYLYFSPHSENGASPRLVYLSYGGTLGFDIDVGRRGHVVPEVDVQCSQAAPACQVYLAISWFQ